MEFGKLGLLCGSRVTGGARRLAGGMAATARSASLAGTVAVTVRKDLFP